MDTGAKQAFSVMAEEAGIKDQQSKILAALRWFGPMTRERIADMTGVCMGSVRGRSYELVRWGRIHVAGHETRPDQPRRQILEAVPDLADRAEVA
jgi:hypothetical protein